MSDAYGTLNWGTGKGGSAMSTTYPNKDRKKLETFRDYYRERQPSPRNYTMIVMGLNTAFRISDLLRLKWQDMCHPDGSLCAHIHIEEQKTGKTRTVSPLIKPFVKLWKRIGNRFRTVSCQTGFLPAHTSRRARKKIGYFCTRFLIFL